MSKGDPCPICDPTGDIVVTAGRAQGHAKCAGVSPSVMKHLPYKQLNLSKNK